MISPARYFTIGFSLTLVKLALDRLVATMVFGKPWSPLSYAITGEIGGVFALARDDQVFYATMLAMALPFLVVGVVLTIRRLRDAGWPLWFVVLFFAPMPINVVFFIVLCLVPSRVCVVHGGLDDLIDIPGALNPKSKDMRPRIAYPRAIMAILIPLPVAAAVAYFGTHILINYGWSLFVGLPFVLPMISVVIYGAGREVTLAQSLSIGLALGPGCDCPDVKVLVSEPLGPCDRIAPDLARRVLRSIVEARQVCFLLE